MSHICATCFLFIIIPISMCCHCTHFTVWSEWQNIGEERVVERMREEERGLTAPLGLAFGTESQRYGRSQMSLSHGVRRRGATRFFCLHFCWKISPYSFGSSNYIPAVSNKSVLCDVNDHKCKKKHPGRERCCARRLPGDSLVVPVPYDNGLWLCLSWTVATLFWAVLNASAQKF